MKETKCSAESDHCRVIIIDPDDAHFCEIRPTGTHQLFTRRFEEDDDGNADQQLTQMTTHPTHTQLRSHCIFHLQNHRNTHRVGPSHNYRLCQFSHFRPRLPNTSQTRQQIEQTGQQAKHSFERAISEWLTKEEAREARQSLVQPVDNGNVVEWVGEEGGCVESVAEEKERKRREEEHDEREMKRNHAIDADEERRPEKRVHLERKREQERKKQEEEEDSEDTLEGRQLKGRK
ncbi:hypothetical protein BLNAU_17956 [Blattamonas nauphoetae]|uniref:Uncharacterized protein n=1 Tax=Blattamonas nauphoetae TaxID=2049346 RepID=A0ABQ9X5R9_9EUKA|nr:hypothetical protein BLNAU_17956 [Blattamonas nauphoetae]